MARASRRAGTPLIARLLREPHRFDFFQAVRLMEWMQPKREPVGDGLGPGREAVRFRATPSLGFPASEIVEIAPPRAEGDVPEITVSFLGLAGANGPLPRPFTELVVERIARKDRGMRDFLDLFHHRLVSLLYKVRRRARVSLHTGSPERATVADPLFALTGLGTLGTRGRSSVNDRALLRYAGILAQRTRSMHGLERILTDYLGVSVRGVPFVGQWIELEPDQRTALGVSGTNAVLGESAVLGSRVWDQQGRFELVVGPLSLATFVEFLPGADRLPKLTALTRLYVGPDLDFNVRLTLDRDDVPAMRLGARPGPRLGWTSWVRTKEYEGDPEIVIHDPARVVAEHARRRDGGSFPWDRIKPSPRPPSPPPVPATAGEEELEVVIAMP